MQRAGIMDFFRFWSKNRFVSNLPHKEEQLLLVSNLKSVWLCGSPFSVSANFNEVHFCTKKNMPNGSSQKLKICRNHIKLRPVQAP